MADRKEVNAKTSYVPIERRVHPRLSVSFPISFQVISGRDSERRSPFREGNLRDVSLGGLCFTTPEIIIDNLHISCDFDEPPYRENLLLMKLTLPEPNEPVTVTGEATWFQQESGGDEPSFAVGVKFLKFLDNTKEIFQNFVKTLR
jgi:hypothetical protein